MKRIISFLIACSIVTSTFIPVFAEEYVNLNPNQEVVITDSTKENDEIETETTEPVEESALEKYSSSNDVFVTNTIMDQEDLAKVLNSSYDYQQSFELGADIVINNPIKLADVDNPTTVNIRGEEHSITITTNGVDKPVFSSKGQSCNSLFLQDTKIVINQPGNIFDIPTGLNDCDVVFNLTTKGDTTLVSNPLTGTAFLRIDAVLFDGNLTLFDRIPKGVSTSNIYMDLSLNTSGYFAFSNIIEGDVSKVIYEDIKSPSATIHALAKDSIEANATVEYVAVLPKQPLVDMNLYLGSNIVGDINYLYLNQNTKLAEDSMPIEFKSSNGVNIHCLDIDLAKQVLSLYSNVNMTVSSVTLDPIYFDNVGYRVPQTINLDVSPFDLKYLGLMGEYSGGSSDFDLSITEYEGKDLATLNINTPIPDKTSYNLTYKVMPMVGKPTFDTESGIWNFVMSDSEYNTLPVSWIEGIIGADSIEFPELDDNTLNISWGEEDKLVKVNPNPSEANLKMNVSSEQEGVIIEITEVSSKQHTFKVKPIEPGTAKVIVSIGDISETLTVNVKSTKESDWIQKVKDLAPPIELTHKEYLEQLFEEYEDLDQSKIPDEVYKHLEDMWDLYLEALHKTPPYVFMGLVDKLPNPGEGLISIQHSEQIAEVMELYQTLTLEDLEVVTEKYKTKYTAVIEEFKQVKDLYDTAVGICDLIDKLPTSDKITIDFEEQINSILTALDTLDKRSPNSYNQDVTTAHREKLQACKEVIDEWKLVDQEVKSWADKVTELIPAKELTLDNYKDILSQVSMYKQEYDNSSEKFKQLVNLKYSEILEKLNEYSTVENDMLILMDKNTAKEFSTKVLAIDLGRLTLADTNLYTNLKATYDKFTERVKSFVSKEALDYLESIRLKLEELQLTEDKQKAATVIEAIQALPKLSDLKIEDESKLASVEEKYSDLTQQQKELVTNYSTLQALRTELNGLQQNLHSVKDFISRVSKLPANSQLIPDNFTEINDLMKLLNNFNPYQQKLLTQKSPSTATTLLNLNNFMLKMLNGVVKDETFGFSISGLVANPESGKLQVSKPIVSNLTRFDEIVAEVSKATGKEVLDMYQLSLTGGNNGDPYSTSTFRFPVPEITNKHTSVGIVLFNPDAQQGSRITTIQPTIRSIDNKSYFEYASSTADYVLVVASPKTFSWVYSFFGKQKIVNITPKELDTSYLVVPTKVNPNVGT